ncbi:MAG: SNF2-related protein, partial [Acidobacteriota bacterium]
MSVTWQTGDRVRHRFNAELGPGVIVAAEGRRLSVFFPQGGETLEIALTSDALARLELEVGGRARVGESGVEVTVEEIDGDKARLADGRWLPAGDLWPLPAPPSPLEKLRRGDLDAAEDFRNRLDALRLERLRSAGGLGTFLGGRIRLYPHQLHVAELATRSLDAGDPVRWLLADEVGLGKTVEACLIMNRLLHGDGVDRALVIAPETLTVQWLGELWRKYHQVFVLLDGARLKDVERDHGEGFNPFDVHRRVILSTELLVENKRLLEQALETGVDLLVLDEAHHLRRRAGQPGNPAYRAFAPLAARAEHILLLTATPLEDDVEGFFRLLQLLRPNELPDADFDGELAGLRARLGRREPLPPCTSATRREDIGGLPPRRAEPVTLDADAWVPQREFLEALRGVGDTESPLGRKRLAERLRRALSSPGTLAGALGDDALEALGRGAAESDPRVAWLVEQTWKWAQAGEKTLIFVADRPALDALRDALPRVQVGIFHEDLSLERRDVEV